MDSLVTTEAFASYLQRDVDTSTAELALQAASGIVRDHCRWDIAEETATFVVDGSGTPILSLPTLRLTDVAEVRLDGVVLDPADCTWSANGLIRRIGLVWPRRFRCVEVDVTHGWAPIPDGIRAVVLTLASRFYANPDKVLSKTVGGISHTYATTTDLNDLELALVDGHRLP
jgi:hypothetical protein